MYLAKDFIQTSEKLVFAVVENGDEQGKVLCFLRYIWQEEKQCWQKLQTNNANLYLKNNYPQYLYYSPIKQAHCHAVHLDSIDKYHQPQERLKHLLKNNPVDEIEIDVQSFCNLLKQQGSDLTDVGITGSILIGAQNPQSDIDLVFYSKTAFDQTRNITQQLIEQGYCSTLNEAQWLESFDRRSCELSYQDYLWHEKRKHNKVIINQRKIDLSFVSPLRRASTVTAYQKQRSIKLTAQITDDNLAFDYPAEFVIKHPRISSIVSYTATYTGQASIGEWVEVAGILEQDKQGNQRIIVGSSREAKGEYIKVLKDEE